MQNAACLEWYKEEKRNGGTRKRRHAAKKYQTDRTDYRKPENISGGLCDHVPEADLNSGGEYARHDSVRTQGNDRGRALLVCQWGGGSTA